MTARGGSSSGGAAGGAKAAGGMAGAAGSAGDAGCLVWEDACRGSLCSGTYCWTEETCPKTGNCLLRQSADCPTFYEITVPPGKRAVLIDGINLTVDTMQLLADKASCSPENMGCTEYPATATQSATFAVRRTPGTGGPAPFGFWFQIIALDDKLDTFTCANCAADSHAQCAGYEFLSGYTYPWTDMTP